MYNISELQFQIKKLQEELSCQVVDSFELGERHRSQGFKPQYPENDWYMLGYSDRDYEIEIGIDPDYSL